MCTAYKLQHAKWDSNSQCKNFDTFITLGSETQIHKGKKKKFPKIYPKRSFIKEQKIHVKKGKNMQKRYF